MEHAGPATPVVVGAELHLALLVEQLADVVLETDPPTLEHVAFGMRSLRDAERKGDLTIYGDRGQAQQLLALFAVPFATAAS